MTLLEFPEGWGKGLRENPSMREVCIFSGTTQFCKIMLSLPQYRNFSNVFSERATGFHGWAKRFELHFFISKTFLYWVKPSGQNHPHSRSICLVPWPLGDKIDA